MMEGAARGHVAEWGMPGSRGRGRSPTAYLLSAGFKNRPVRGPGLQGFRILAISRRPRALTRRPLTISKPALRLPQPEILLRAGRGERDKFLPAKLQGGCFHVGPSRAERPGGRLQDKTRGGRWPEQQYGRPGPRQPQAGPR